MVTAVRYELVPLSQVQDKITELSHLIQKVWIIVKYRLMTVVLHFLIANIRFCINPDWSNIFIEKFIEKLHTLSPVVNLLTANVQH